MLKQRVFPATDDSLDEATAFIEEVLEEADCPMKAEMQITVAFEEIFVNIAHYAYPAGNGDMVLSIGVEDGVMTMLFEDSGIPFDPLAKPDPDITLSAEDRDIGGLGIFMVKKSMDEVAYERRGEQNVLKLVKRIG